MNTPPAKVKTAREVALDCLVQIVTKGRSLAELQSHLNEHQNAAQIREMVFGVCRWFYYFDAMAKEQLKKPIRKKDHDVLLVIFLGMYQLQFMHTSDHAAVNETVNLVFKIRKKWAKGLVNALLRQFAKKSFDEENLIEHGLSYPQWMSDKIQQDWPEDKNDVFKYGNQKASISLRVNAKKIKTAEYLQQLTDAEIDFDLEPALPAYIRLTHAQNVMELPGFEDGVFYVQDGSAQMASPLLNVRQGMRVLDACAAPGGKSTHIAEIMSDKVEIVALEKEPKRIPRFKDNMARLGHDIEIICGDATKPDSWFDGTLFDRILIDAPCSASGIIRRHPDIKVLRQADDIDQLAILQAEILKALWPLLKPDGELLYCTCSLFKQENEDQIEAFIKQQDNCNEIKIDPVSWTHQRPFGLQVLPSEHGHDGFYYAKLKKLAK